MPKLLMLQGLPGSGKSTYAKSLKGYKRVNMDDLRRMLDDGKWSKQNEKVMQQVRLKIVADLLIQGHNVVVDDTNLHPKHEQALKELVKYENMVTSNFNAHMGGEGVERPHITYSEQLIDTPLKQCIEQDLKREHSVGKDVIMRMYNQYLAPKPAEAPEWDYDLPDCIIVDIDGTVALMQDRSPYDWDRVDEDLPNIPVINLIQHYYDASKTHVVFLSGRDGSCREKTNNWIIQNFGYASGADLHMRAEGDQRKDSIVKEELYNAHVKGQYNVQFVLDDRQQVVDMWRSLGLTCLQVAPGDF